MKVLLLEDNLMWSVRTRKGLETLGCKVIVVSKPTDELPPADLAIVNLGAKSLDPFKCIAALKKRGTRTIGHIGHKEKDIWEQGEKAGCDVVVSNGSLAHKLASLIE